MTGALLPATTVPRERGSITQIAAAVEALPLPRDDAPSRWTLRGATAAWLASRRSSHTRRSYFADLTLWLGWCDRAGLDPRQALRADVDLWTTTITGSAATIARRLSAVSSWYDYLESNQLAGSNPARAVTRPRVDRDSSPTVGLTAAQAGQLIRTARSSTRRCAARDTAALGLLLGLGLRVGELVGLDVEQVRYNRGHRTVMVVGKGGRRRELPIPPQVGRDLDVWLEVRAGLGAVLADAGPLLVTATGRRLDQPGVLRMLRRVAAAAGIREAAALSPHSLRHTAITAALDAGAQLREVQDMAGHADPRTTRRYDHGRGSLDRSPTYRLGAILGDD